MIRLRRDARADPEMRSLLSGDDRRPIARSERVSRIIHEHPARVAELARLFLTSFWLFPEVRPH